MTATDFPPAPEGVHVTVWAVWHANDSIHANHIDIHAYQRFCDTAARATGRSRLAGRIPDGFAPAMWNTYKATAKRA